MFVRWVPLLALLGVPWVANAGDLLGAWQAALNNSPEYRAAGFVAAGERAGVDVARSRLLPRIDASAAAFQNSTKRDLANGPLPSSSFHYGSERASLQFSVPLVQVAGILDWDRARASADAAEEAYRAQEQMLAVKVTQRYFDVVLAREQVASARRKQSALEEVFRVAEKSFVAGVASRTDVDDARAMRDTAVADVLEAEGAIAVTEQALAAVTGEFEEAGTLLGLPEKNLLPELPSMLAVTEWLELAGRNSPEIASARFAQQAAAFNERRVLMSRVPTLELVASKGNSSSDGESNIGYQYKTDAIGLQFTFPLYSSGGARAALRQATAARGKATAEFDAATAGVRLEITREHALVRAGFARVQALQTALDSAAQSVAGNEKGIQAGTRNVIDLINARQRYFEVQADLLKARCQYVVATLRLKALAGLLGPDDMRQVNGWLK